MCELFALSANVPVDVKLSLAELAQHGGKTGIHADGWGVAFLDGRDARLFRDPGPAAFSPWIDCLGQHPIRSDTVLAHIRHATRGTVSLANTQPFLRELDGRVIVFAHNGDLGALPPAAGPFQQIGDTDSEAAFCNLLHQFTTRSSARRDLAALFDIFASCVAEYRQYGPANVICGFDGTLFVHADRRTQGPGVIAPPGLWLLRRECHGPEERIFSGAGAQVAGHAVEVTLIASVPLSTEPWRPLAQGTTLAVRAGTIIMERALPEAERE